VIARSESIDPMALELEDWPLEPDQIVDGDPQVSGRVLDTSADGKVERGPTLEVGPGDVGLLHAGDRTTWTVHEDLRKIFQTTSD
jgi:uncharacterized cupin superfamily protein